MTFMMQDQKLMTTDARGRVRVPEERREALLDEFERSGLSGVKFAQLVGVKYPTFALWVQKRRKARKAQSVDGAGAGIFVEAVVDRSAGVVVGGAGLTIELPGGARLFVQSPVQLQMAAELLRMMASSGARGC
jgi:hypothetical protein